MSLSQKQNDVSRTFKDLADLQKQLAAERKKESAKLKDADSTRRGITKYTSPSMSRQKQQKLISLSDDISKIVAKQADIQKKIADKNKQLDKQQDDLRQEEFKERKKVLDADKKRETERLRHQRELTNELRTQSDIRSVQSSINQLSYRSTPQVEPKRYDAFISHASEDKEGFVRPLAEALVEAGFSIWYDEMTLTVGDQLRRSIDRGLSASRYGIVVLSTAFFSKNWPNYELDGLVTREMAGGGKVILPIWHKVSKDEVMAYSTSLADKVAINSSISGREEIVNQLSEVLTRD